MVRDNTGDYTFQEAFDRTGRIINITVAPMNDYEPPRLLNYLTAPHVCVWSAAAASCAIPGMYLRTPMCPCAVRVCVCIGVRADLYAGFPNPNPNLHRLC